MNPLRANAELTQCRGFGRLARDDGVRNAKQPAVESVDPAASPRLADDQPEWRPTPRS